MRADDPFHLTPQERFEEVAKILAAGLRALRESARRESLNNSPESSQDSLDPRRDLRLSVHRG